MMADRKRNQRADDEEKPTKEELAVAKFLRFNVPSNEAKFHGMEVQYFSASNAVDCLMKSEWSSSANAEEPLFSNRKSCASYCQRLLHKGMFHRAERMLRKKDMGEKSKKKKLKDSPEKDDGGTGDEMRERKRMKDKQRKDETDGVPPEETEQAEEVKENDAPEEKAVEKKEDREKKKKKPLKLIMTDDQRFLDGEQYIYVWIFNPTSAKTLLIGSLIVLGSIAICLYPVWPPAVRVGVYYISLASAAFIGVILSLVIIRLILFCLIWVASQGRHYFWLLPNLTEEVSIVESFRPLYSHRLVDKAAPASAAKDTETKLSVAKAKGKGKSRSSDKDDSASDQDEFEIVQRGDVEKEDEEEARPEDMEDSEENGIAREEEDEDVEEEEENGDEEEAQEDGEEEDQDGDEDEEAELKKDK